MSLNVNLADGHDMNPFGPHKAVALSILTIVLISYCCVTTYTELAGASRTTGTQLSVSLVHGNTQSGPLSVSINDTIVASNIDASKKNSLVIPITVPDNLLSGPLRICATGGSPSSAQICTDFQNVKQGEKNKVTLDLAKAVVG